MLFKRLNTISNNMKTNIIIAAVVASSLVASEPEQTIQPPVPSITKAAPSIDLGAEARVVVEAVREALPAFDSEDHARQLRQRIRALASPQDGALAPQAVQKKEKRQPRAFRLDERGRERTNATEPDPCSAVAKEIPQTLPEVVPPVAGHPQAKAEDVCSPVARRELLLRRVSNLREAIHQLEADINDLR